MSSNTQQFESWRVEKVRPSGPPTSTSWSTSTGAFHNAGLATFVETRSQWKVRTVQTTPPPPPPVRYDELVNGLTQTTRTWELPGRMKLEDLVDVFNDIWECEQGF
ncbi:hypothetical protein TrCOL_g2258 [Triparma columacea]|uniref:DUF4050 domain-containing protein n=1 Tax=Triparma columacea TaxID=722753 RepID=A0A9W7FW64_9STRA|nr:hypothetical protein TrCOL_g2258 [Triparma columacea]